MGLLDLVNISFTSTPSTAIRFGERGKVALLLQDTAENVGVTEVRNLRTIPKGLNEKNKEYIKMAMIGADEPPTSLTVFVEELVGGGVTWDPAKNPSFAKLENGYYDYVALPEITSADAGKVAEWVKDANLNTEHMLKVVLPNQSGNDQHIINFATESVTLENKKTYSTTEFTPRIAGFIAAMPPTRSITYAELPEVVSVPAKPRKELDDAAKEGELHLFNDGQKTRFASGVNSLKTLKMEQNNSYKQIKETEIMDMLHNFIKKALLENFIGKYSNSYKNKLLLVSEITDFLKSFERRGLLEVGESYARIDFDAQKEYLREKNYTTVDGRKVDEMSDQEIYRGNTDNKVFIHMRVLILGAIESIDITVHV